MPSSLRGQTEIIVIVAIIIVVIAVVIFALQGLPLVEPSFTEEQRSVRDSVSNFIREGAEQTLRTVSLYGGYKSGGDISTSFEVFEGKEVPYWSFHGRKTIPNARLNFEETLAQHLAANKDAFAAGFDREVSLGTPRVSANVLPSRIDLRVEMDTTMDGQLIRFPYQVSVGTKFGEILEFGDRFVTEVNNKRFFEYFTLESIILSPLNGLTQEIPFYIDLANCGEFVFKTWDDIQPSMSNAIETVLAHTYMSGKEPTGVGEETSFLKEVFVPLNGKTYSDLRVSFFRPDTFELTRQNFRLTPEPIIAFATPIGITGICRSDPVYITYSLLYPGVVNVVDPLTENQFRFAFDVFIESNGPGNWGNIVSALPAEAEVCANPQCAANIQVADTSGNPLTTGLAFLGCSYRTNSQGRYEGLVPCGISDFEVRKSGYSPHVSTRSSDELGNFSITLKRQPVTVFYFHEVIVDVSGPLNQPGSLYLLSPENVKWITTEGENRQNAILTFFSQESADTYQIISPNTAFTASYIPADAYSLSGAIMDRLFLRQIGGVGAVLNLREDERAVHVYIVSNPQINDIEDSTAKADAINTLTKFIEKCGIPAMSTAEVSTPGNCVKKFEEL